MPEKRYLVTPGPTPVPPEVLAATALPMIHHRSADFRAAFERVLGRLAEVYRTQNDVLLFTSAGTAAHGVRRGQPLSRPATASCASPHGYFGERWAEIARATGSTSTTCATSWGETPNPDEVGARLEEIGGAKVVYLTHSDTSTGALPTSGHGRAPAGSGRSSPSTPSRACGACRSRPTSLGPRRRRDGLAEGADVPAGLAFAGVSPAALGATETAASRASTSTGAARSRRRPRGETPFSTAISLVRGLDVALEMILEDGLETALGTHFAWAGPARAGVKAMGLELFSPDEDTSAVVTAIRMPEEIDGQAIVAAMREESA